VVIGVLLQFTVMLLVGTCLRLCSLSTRNCGRDALIGSCSSGLASNVMSYPAANLTLSSHSPRSALTADYDAIVDETAGRRMVPIDFVGMMLTSSSSWIVPIGGNVTRLSRTPPSGRRLFMGFSCGWSRVAILAGAGRMDGPVEGLAPAGWQCST
jgi:hypothetical protein